MNITDVLRALLFGSVFTSLIILIEIIKRKSLLTSEITRRIDHLMAGCYAIICYYYLPFALFIFLFLSFLIVISYSHYKNIFTSVHQVRRQTYGAMLFPLAVIIIFLISQINAHIFLPSILIITIADSLAGIASDIEKKSHKTRAGFIVFFITTLIILSITLPNLPWSVSIIVSIILAIVERLSKYGTDNITVPIASAILLLLLQV